MLRLSEHEIADVKRLIDGLPTSLETIMAEHECGECAKTTDHEAEVTTLDVEFMDRNALADFVAGVGEIYESAMVRSVKETIDAAASVQTA